MDGSYEYSQVFKALDDVGEEAEDAYSSDGTVGSDAEDDTNFKPVHHKRGAQHGGRRCLQVQSHS